MRTVTLALVILLTGCQSVPTVPETVTVTVERMTPPPQWATDPLPVAPAGRTVGERLQADDTNRRTLELANCHRALLARLGAGQAAERDDCAGTD